MKIIKNALIVLCLAVGGHASAQIFSDTFTEATVPSSLHTVIEGAPSIVNYDGTNALQIPDGVSYVALGTTITGNFTLSWNVAMDSYSRIEGIELLSAPPDGSTATQGYGIFYNSGNSGFNNGLGEMYISKITVAANDANAGDYSVATPTANAVRLGLYDPTIAVMNGQLPVTPSIANGPRYDTTMSLSWNGVTNSLALSVNGNVVDTVTDSSFASFSDLVLVGNSNGLVNNVVVTTVPEPSTFALLGVAGFAMLVWNQRRFMALRWGQPTKPSV